MGKRITIDLYFPGPAFREYEKHPAVIWLVDHGYKRPNGDLNEMTYFAQWLGSAAAKMRFSFHPSRVSDAMLFKLTFGGL